MRGGCWCRGAYFAPWAYATIMIMEGGQWHKKDFRTSIGKPSLRISIPVFHQGDFIEVSLVPQWKGLYSQPN